MSENPENIKYIKSKGKTYDIVKKIGERNFGIVYLTKIKDNNELRVIKIYDKNQIREYLGKQLLKIPTEREMKELYLDRIYSEIENMKIMEGENGENNNTIKIFDYFENENEIGLIMEACDDNFQHFLEKKNKFNSSKIYEILGHLNNCFKIMAKKKLIHRALSLENLIIKYRDQTKSSYLVKLKLIDDSILLKDLVNKNKYSELNGKPIYFAPEVLNGDEYDEKCDLWSLGILIFELYFKELPFNGETDMEVLNNINDNYNKFKEKLKEGKDPILNDLILKLMNPDVKKRYNWEQYFDHPFFRKKEKSEKFYELIKCIGTTKFAKIYSAKEIETNNLRAVKIYDKNKIRKEIKNLKKELTDEEMKPYIDGFYREVELMKIIQGKNEENKNAVKIYEYFDNDDEFSIVMELCDNNLFSIFLKSQPFNDEKILDLLIQLNNSFRIMFEKKFVHRALNLENILIKEDNENNKYIYKLKITNDCDYLDNLIKNYEKNKFPNINGLINYISPEILKGEKCDLNCDLWSLGIIIYALYFKVYPYNGQKQRQLLNDIKKVGKNFKKASNENINDLINRLLNVNPKERMTWEQYFNHRIFKNIKRFNKSIHKKDYKNQYDTLDKIGFSGFATILKAKKRETGDFRAIKIYDVIRIKHQIRSELNRIPTEKDIQPYKDRFNNEIKYMKIIGGKNNENKNAIIFYDSFENENEMGIIMELGDENLLTTLTKRKKSFNSKEISYILKQINNSFIILHEQKIVHRALNLSNILVKYLDNEHQKYIVKLLMTDDSISLDELPNNPIFDNPHTNIHYFAPEVLKKNDSFYNEKCDLWSLGIIIYVLCFQEFPYKGKDENEILDNIRIIGQNFNEISDNRLNDLMKNLLNDDVNQRYGWAQYFKHPFFSVNKTNIY